MASKGKGIADDYGSAGKRKRDDGDKAGRRRKNPGVLQFFDDAAYEIDESSDSSDDSGFDDGIKLKRRAFSILLFLFYVLRVCLQGLFERVLGLIEEMRVRWSCWGLLWVACLVSREMWCGLWLLLV